MPKKKKPKKNSLKLLKNIKSNEKAKITSALDFVKRGMYSQAVKLCIPILERNPKNVEALHLMGLVNLKINNFNKAALFLQKAADNNCNNFELYSRLGIVYFHLNKWEHSITSYQKSIDLNPNNPSTFFNLGHVYFVIKKYDEALISYKKAVDLNPKYYHALTNIGVVYMDLGDKVNSLEYLNKSLTINPKHIDTYINLAKYWNNFGNADDEEKIEFYSRKAYQLQPENEFAISNLAAYLEKQKKYSEAYKLLSPLVEKGNFNDEGIAIVFAKLSVHFDKQKDAIKILNNSLALNPLRIETRKNLHFALGFLHDNIEDFDTAFKNYYQANEYRKSLWGNSDREKILNNIKKVYANSKIPYSSNKNELPIFILGMPRSGTSLIEQIIASHSSCHAGGELDFLGNYVKSLPERLSTKLPYPECIKLLTKQDMENIANDYIQHLTSLLKNDNIKRVTDKMPSNFWRIGLIHHLFPHARIIHCKRNPLDTCLSCYFQDFSIGHSYKNDLTTLGKYYKQYLDIIQFWKDSYDLQILEMHYEDLVEKPEENIRSIINFCGLEWEESCLEFYKLNRWVATSSYSQVIQPIYNKSVNRWKNYEKHLQKLIQFFEGMD